MALLTNFLHKVTVCFTAEKRRVLRKPLTFGNLKVDSHIHDVKMGSLMGDLAFIGAQIVWVAQQTSPPWPCQL